MKIANERREKPRISLKGAAFLFDRRGRQQVEVRNLSAVGILVGVGWAPAPKEQVRLGLCLDGKSWLELDGIVRRVAKSECAIDLRPSNATALEAIDAYVKRISLALTLAKQRDMFAKRMSGVEQKNPATTRDELIRRVLPTAVMPPREGEDGPAHTPLPAHIAEEVQARAEAARKKRAANTPARPKKVDPKLRSLYRAAVDDVDTK